jgi:hypothetical protein
MQPISGGTKPFHRFPVSCYTCERARPISVSIGTEMIASLNNGKIGCPSFDLFSAPWFAESFASTRSELWEMHEAARGRAKKPWATLDPKFARFIAQQGTRRIISLIRNSRHGGMLVYLPTEMGRDISATNRHISLKYRFREEEPRQRFYTLILRIMNTFAELHGESGNSGKSGRLAGIRQ